MHKKEKKNNFTGVLVRLNSTRIICAIENQLKQKRQHCLKQPSINNTPYSNSSCPRGATLVSGRRFPTYLVTRFHCMGMGTAQVQGMALAQYFLSLNNLVQKF